MVPLLLCILPAVFTPEDFGHFRGTWIKLLGVLVPDVACGVESLQATNALEHVGAERCCLGRGHATLVAESGTCGEECDLSLDGLGHLARHQAIGLVAKHEVEIGIIGAKSLILCGDFVSVGDVDIVDGEVEHGTVAVGEALLHAIGESGTCQIEIGTTILRCDQQGNTVEHAIGGIATMCLQQIVIEKRTQAESLTFQAVDEHLLL